MKLSDLIKNCSSISSAQSRLPSGLDPDISHIASDSRNVRPGTLFIAIKGLVADGHDYMEQAFENGAVAVIAQTNPKNLAPVILVENSRRSMAAVAAAFYGHPSKDLMLVGITGTNGKTTTTWLLESIFKACGFSTGVIGTINIRYDHKVFTNPVTTPDSIDLQRTLCDMKKAGITHVIMEVSSHGLDLNRVDDCQFDAGVFTNLTQDHLDYHHTLDDYFDCKKRFFTHLLGANKKKTAVAAINIDDPKGQLLSQSIACKIVTVSTGQKADIVARNISDDIFGLSGTILLPHGSFELVSTLTGRFNLENILCATGAAHALDISREKIKQGIENCSVIPGRLEKIDTTIDRHLFVDYAHTPDALESILKTLKKRAPKRVITIFGCGGDRDRAKRPLMGQIACRYSDIAIATSDNPRTESPAAIITDILKGLDAFEALSDTDLESNPFKQGYWVEVDRKKAIKKAISISKPGDIVIAAGKGHETYQVTNSGTIHFDDKEEFGQAAMEFAQKFEPIAWSRQDLSAALENDPILSDIRNESSFTGISTDSRTIQQTQVFLALNGERFDAHTFIPGLVDQGINCIIAQTGYMDALDADTRKKIKQKDLILFETPNTLTALGKLARYQRLRSKVKLIAITGSSGKTTTRKITEEIFKTQFHTLATRGNLNNEIGVPLTLLNLSSAHEWAIVEMGMNHPGEISRLSRIALPDVAMVTNIAGVHLEGLGTVDNVAHAKSEISDGIRKHGTIILPGNDQQRSIIETKARANKNIEHIQFFGSTADADVQSVSVHASPTSIDFVAKKNDQKTAYTIHSPAPFMVDNCLAAICAANVAGVSQQGIKKGIQAFTPVAGRMHIYKLSSFVTLMDDTYNANPSSVTQALKTLKAVSRGQNSIAILGDMLELGKDSNALHYDIGRKAADLKISKLYVFGSQAEYIVKGAVERGFPLADIFHGTKDKIVHKVRQDLDTETWILVKGSRGMAMETIIHDLEQILTANS